MDIKIISNKEEKLFNRSRIEFSMAYAERTPSKEEAKVELCKKLNLRPEFTIITGIHQEFGSRMSMADAHTYLNKESLEKFEPKYLLNRLNKKDKGATEEKKEEKPAAEHKEQKKREPKEEAKPEKQQKAEPEEKK